MKLDKSAIEEPLWICVDCVRERCYRFPQLGNVAAKVIKCAYCGAFGPCWDIDDLVPGWEEEISE